MDVFRVFVAAVVIRDGAVLLLRRSQSQGYLPGVWGVPCGKIEFGEPVEDAVLRELAEESGLRGRVARLVGHSAFMTVYRGTDCHNVQLTFLVDADDREVVLSDEHDAHKWHPVADLENSGADAYNAEVIRQAL